MNLAEAVLVGVTIVAIIAVFTAVACWVLDLYEQGRER